VVVVVAAVAGAADGNRAMMRGHLPAKLDEDVADTKQEEAQAEDGGGAGVEREVEAEEDAQGSASGDPVGA
jgi:hypothetical protein